MMHRRFRYSRLRLDMQFRELIWAPERTTLCLLAYVRELSILFASGERVSAEQTPKIKI